ncbi:MAG: hypothetical protein ACJ746_26435 [Bryobacteraceae bacterium]
MVKDLAAQIEDALGSGEFELAQFLFSQYTRLLDDELDEAHSSLEGKIISDALQMLKRWLSIARVVRAHISEELRVATCEHSYSSHPSAVPILELVG